MENSVSALYQSLLPRANGLQSLCVLGTQPIVFISQYASPAILPSFPNCNKSVPPELLRK